MQKNLLRLGKLLLALSLIVVIYRYFFHFENLKPAIQKLTEIPRFIFVIALLATLLNWSLETLKWQNLLGNLQTVTFYTALKSTCAGAAVSNIFPFRIGEYLGRMVYVKPENHIPALFNSVLGSTAQFLISVGIGIPASLVILSREYRDISFYAGITAGITVLVFICIFIIFRKNPQSRYKWLNRLSMDIRRFTIRQIAWILLLSFLRYMVYASFYAGILVFFDVTADPLYAFSGVSTVYLMQSFAPSMIITDAGLRTALPLLVFSGSTGVESSVLAAALLNYAFNVLLPSLIGLFFIIAEKVKSP